MFRLVLTSAFLIGAATVAGTPTTMVVGKALAAPQSREQGSAAIDDATAAALIGAISSQFDEREVEVRLGHVVVAPAGLVQRDIRGTGKLRIGRDPAWIAFDFRALYDTESASVASPQVVLGSVEPARNLARDTPVAKALGEAVKQRLRREFAQQATTLQLDDVRSAPAGDRFLQLDARGIANFGADGRAPARIHALYDPRSGQWLQLVYELDGERQSS